MRNMYRQSPFVKTNFKEWHYGLAFTIWMEGNGVKTHLWRSNIVMLIKFDVQSKNTTCVKIITST